MITKTIVESKCIGYRVVNDELVDFEHITFGKLDTTKASKLMRKLYNDDSIIVVSVEISSKHYEMDEEEFIKHATELEI